MFPGSVRGEGPFPLRAVDLGQDDLVVGIPDLNVHPDPGGRGGEAVGAGIVQLDLVVA